MILVDTSAWIEYLRGSDDEVVARLRTLIENDVELAITEPIAMELLAGATTARLERDIGALVDGVKLLPLDARMDYRVAAQVYVASRRNGHPLRSLIDCLIAAVAMRRDVELLHRDRDFAFIADVAPLRIAGL